MKNLRKRSHLLFVLSEPKAGQEAQFLDWYRTAYRRMSVRTSGVIDAQQYERHEVDITQGHYAPLPFRYLALYEIAVDGAEAAEGLIDSITTLHLDQAAALAPATWLYFPVSEKVGHAPKGLPSMLTLAFANGLPGREAEFSEWYATRHIRHALSIPALVSGQCYQRTQFQKPGALEAKFHTIALYEQEGPPEAIIESFASLPKGTLDFPAMDLSRFAEAVYRPLKE